MLSAEIQQLVAAWKVLRRFSSGGDRISESTHDRQKAFLWLEGLLAGGVRRTELGLTD
jgi:hypothetical protein